jgi:hypothetical protein
MESIHLVVDAHGLDSGYISSDFYKKVNMMFLSSTNSYNWAPISRSVMKTLQVEYKKNTPTEQIIDEFRKECVSSYDKMGLPHLLQETELALHSSKRSTEEKELILKASDTLLRSPERICYRGGVHVNRVYTFTDKSLYFDQALDYYDSSVSGENGYKRFAGCIMVLRVVLQNEDGTFMNMNTPFNLMGNTPIPLLDHARHVIRDTLYHHNGNITLEDILSHLTMFKSIYIYDLACRVPEKSILRSTTAIFNEEQKQRPSRPLTRDQLHEYPTDITIDDVLRLIELSKEIQDSPFFDRIQTETLEFKIQAVHGKKSHHDIVSKIKELEQHIEERDALYKQYHTLLDTISDCDFLEQVELRHDLYIFKRDIRHYTKSVVTMKIAELKHLGHIHTLFHLAHDYCHDTFFNDYPESVLIECQELNEMIHDAIASLKEKRDDHSTLLHNKISRLLIELEDKKIWIDRFNLLIKELYTNNIPIKLNEFIEEVKQGQKTKQDIVDKIDTLQKIKELDSYVTEGDTELKEFIRKAKQGHVTIEEIDEAIDNWGYQVVPDYYSEGTRKKRYKRKTNHKRYSRKKRVLH